MHISVHEKILAGCQLVAHSEHVSNSHSMNMDMIDKIRALLSGFRILNLGARYGIEDSAATVRISLLYHVVERKGWREISSR